MNKQQLILIFCLTLIPFCSQAQNVRTYLINKAETAANIGDYPNALLNISRIPGKEKDFEVLQLQGDYEFHLYQYQNALEHFLAAAQQSDPPPELISLLIRTLLLLDRSPEAIHWATTYANRDSIRWITDEHIPFWKNIQSKDYPAEFKVTFLPFNTLAPELRPLPYKDKLYYSGIQENSLIFTWSEIFGGDLMDIYEVNKDTAENWGSYGSPVTGPINQASGSELPLFFNQEDELLFTRSFYKTDNPGNMKMGFEHFVTQIGQKSKPQSTQTYCKNDSSIIQVAPSPSGDSLIFASRRLRGVGGYDLFLIHRTDSGWSTPQNLGPGINTPGNETYPFLAQNGNFYFSSDGHPGYGGQDIFQSQLLLGKWTAPLNLGKSINSFSHDFNYISIPGDSVGYFVSDRKGNDKDWDIYQFNRLEPRFESCPQMVPDTFCYFMEAENLIHVPYLQVVQWDLGDGTIKYGKNCVHCYETYDDYLISLSLLDSVSGNIEFTSPDYLTQVHPANLIKIETTQQQSGIKFIPTYAFPTSGGQELGYWDFGDGKKTRGNTVHHTFSKPGTYNVRYGVIRKDSNASPNQEECICTQVTVDARGELIPIENFPNQPDMSPEYRIWLGATSRPWDIIPANFMGLLKVERTYSKEQYHYTWGRFPDWDSAKDTLNWIQQVGFEQARPVLFQGEKLIDEQELSNKLLPLSHPIWVQRASLTDYEVLTDDPLFSAGSMELNPLAHSALYTLLRFLLEHPRYQLEISGFPEEGNPKSQIGLKRASKVGGFLVMAGLPIERIAIRQSLAEGDAFSGLYAYRTGKLAFRLFHDPSYSID